ncbi:hypothetical protein CAOG_02704 [Capsaspora owczarzaki ATCC 30864]|uniref:FAD/NAD(P)-binding domain-containing protein n=1 Tax=Capsaspora owczarzaki (strain ATCC 30864) TaxID=595528 RepID=A0A0D2VN03_CAPO3|nr:hypothetical protein CAOG_02704 [Capsaspora owczarzaki ATCC 30864]KJE91582.1 hypothetical protein CAOG_002704 [Capsaspora owczarzaki ATCC 30864]|eukprot:XP_004349454.2 hypothetical protein CAOG_02704 [Capsaspora owczarzaki ATCC 30864]
MADYSGGDGSTAADLSAQTWTVVGAGPAGVLMVGQLLRAGVAPDHLYWVDLAFKGGAMGEHYRGVPSNSKTIIYRWVLERMGHSACADCKAMLDAAEVFPPLALVGNFLACMTKEYEARGVRCIRDQVASTSRSAVTSASNANAAQEQLLAKKQLAQSQQSQTPGSLPPSPDPNASAITMPIAVASAAGGSVPTSRATSPTHRDVNEIVSLAVNASGELVVSSSTPRSAHSRTTFSWNVSTASGQQWHSDVVVVATGATPRSRWIAVGGKTVEVPSDKLVSLIECLNKESLAALLAPLSGTAEAPRKPTIGIVGNSHTAYLVAMFLVELGAAVRIYAREPGSVYVTPLQGLTDLEYYMSDGLKGPVAHFVLNGNRIPGVACDSPSQVEVFTGEDGIASLLECDRVLLAIGFEQRPPQGPPSRLCRRQSAVCRPVVVPERRCRHCHRVTEHMQ